MHDRFANIPEDKDTKILFRHQMKFGELECLYEKWIWDEFAGESLIFVSEDVAHLDDAALKAEVEASPLVNGEPGVTVSRGDSGYTFVNFNFNTDDAERVYIGGETSPLDEFLKAVEEVSKESRPERRRDVRSDR